MKDKESAILGLGMGCGLDSSTAGSPIWHVQGVRFRYSTSFLVLGWLKNYSSKLLVVIDGQPY